LKLFEGGELNLQSVTRKDGEPFESLVRRFNRKVQQSGNLTYARKRMYFEKDLSKREEREIAIRKKARKEQKVRQQLIKGY
jgi:ribosomal protein S21